MAIWDGSSLNTDALSSNVNKWDDLNFSPIVVKRNFLLYAMIAKSGMSGNQNVPNWNSLFKKDYEVSGNNLTKRILGELETINTLADANQLDAVSWNNNPNAIGAATWAWTHYSHNEGVRDSEYDLIRGSEARTQSYMQDMLQRLTLSREKAIGDAINSTNDQARTTLGGWEYAIDSTGTYGTLTRAGDNPDWSANERDVAGSGNLDDLDAARADCQEDGGAPSIAVCAKVPYNKIKQELRGYACGDPTEWRMYGGGNVTYDGITYGLETRCTSSVVGLLEPESFRFYRQTAEGEAAFSVIGEDIMKAILKGAKLGFAFRDWTAFVNVAPSHNCKLTNWTS